MGPVWVRRRAFTSRPRTFRQWATISVILYLTIFCLQATFCGSSLGKKKGFHFTAQDFEAMGYDFCDTLLDYCDPDTSKVLYYVFWGGGLKRQGPPF